MKSVDPSDHEAVLEWAQGICRGVSVEEIANIEGVEPTTPAVVKVLVGDLPDGVTDETRERAAQVCTSELEAFGRGRRVVIEALASEAKTASIPSSSDELTRTFGAVVDQIQRHAMVAPDTAQLTLAVKQVLEEYLMEAIPLDTAGRIAGRIRE